MKRNKIFLAITCFFISILGSSSANTNEADLDNIVYDFYSDKDYILVNVNYHDYIEGTIPNNYVNKFTFYLNKVLFYESEFETLSVNFLLKIPKKDLLDGANCFNYRILFNKSDYENNLIFDLSDINLGYITNFNESYKGKIKSVYQGTNFKKYYFEKISFNGFYETIESNVYHRIDLSSLTINVENLLSHSLEDSEGYLEIFVPDGTFPRLAYDSENNCYKVPIEFYIKNNEIKLRFKTMFFDEDTLMMSYKSGDYFKKTNNFYLPISEYELLKDFKVSLVGENIGFSKFCFKYDFNYVSLNSFLGDCVTSMFCIETRVNES
ncbi:MAG: hypothetical protein ACI311_01625 [Bacilli bacterium]